MFSKDIRSHDYPIVKYVWMTLCFQRTYVRTIILLFSVTARNERRGDTKTVVIAGRDVKTRSNGNLSCYKGTHTDGRTHLEVLGFTPPPPPPPPPPPRSPLPFSSIRPSDQSVLCLVKAESVCLSIVRLLCKSQCQTVRFSVQRRADLCSVEYSVYHSA